MAGSAHATKTAPGPRSYWPLGSLRALQHEPLRFFLDLTRRYGDIVRLRIGPWFVYFLNHPEYIKYVLQETYRNYYKGRSYKFFKPLLGTGLLTSESDFWLRQRRLAQPAFHRQRLAALTSVMIEATDSMLERWQGHARSGQPLDVAAEMAHLTLSIAGQALFSTDVRAVADLIGRTATIAQEHIYYRSMRVLTLPESIPTPRNRRVKKAIHGLDRIVYRLIEERRRNGTNCGDLLSMFLQARDEETGQGMNDKQLRDEVVTMLLAGHETTAVALTWTWYLLSTHPAIEQRLHAETVAALGHKAPTFDDLPVLNYVTMVVQEAMRLYPPAWIISRAAVENDVIGGYDIPRNAELLLSPYVTHRDPRFWENPEGFDPDRFLLERVADRPRFAYFPFGGPRRASVWSSP